MKLHDNYPTGQAVPAGFEKLSDLRERIGAEELEKRLQLGVTKSVELITEDGRIEPVSVDNWRSEFASGMLNSGYKQHYFSPELPDDPANSRESFSYGSSWRLLLARFMQRVDGCAVDCGAFGKIHWISPAFGRTRFSPALNQSLGR